MPTASPRFPSATADALHKWRLNCPGNKTRSKYSLSKLYADSRRLCPARPWKHIREEEVQIHSFFSTALNGGDGQLRPLYPRQMNTTNHRIVGWVCSRVGLDALVKRNVSCPCRHSIPWPSSHGLVTTSADVLPAAPRSTFTEHTSHTPRHRILQYLSDVSHSQQKPKLSYFQVHPRVCGLQNQLPSPYTISPCQVTTNKINTSAV